MNINKKDSCYSCSKSAVGKIREIRVLKIIRFREIRVQKKLLSVFKK